MAAFVTSGIQVEVTGNAIAEHLNNNKKAQDVGMFLQYGKPFNVYPTEFEKKAVSEAITARDLAGSTAEQSVYNEVYKKSIEKYTYNAITQAIKQTLNIKNEPIKLIILEIKGNDTLALDCNAFLLNSTNMELKRYYNNLNHVIIGKTDDEYTVIGYIENVKQETLKPRVATTSAPCTTFKLKETDDKCALLPEIIKSIIFKCIKQHYDKNTEPGAMKLYYNPTTKEYEKEVVAENVEETQLAAAAEAAKIKEKDKCDFKASLKSKIKNNESNEYCKVTDEGLLERIQQNIDGNKVDVDINGVNDLIKTRLVNLKKVKEEEDADEDEEKEREDGKKTISEKKEAFMIKEANEMYVISREVSKKISEGATYSSEKFFKEYLKNTMVTEPETPVAAATTPVAVTAEATPVAVTAEATPVAVTAEATPVAVTAEATPETEAPVAEAPVAEAPVAEAPGQKEVTLSQPQQNLKGVVKRVIKQRRKSPVNPFTFTPI
jgi:hypothetical protein